MQSTMLKNTLVKRSVVASRPSRLSSVMVLARGSGPTNRDRFTAGATPSGGSMAQRRTQVSEDIQRKGQDLLESTRSSIQASTRDLQQWWEEQDEKPLLISIGVAAFALLILGFRVVDLVDHVPLMGPLLEFVGLLYSAFFVYQNLLFKPDRERLLGDIQNVLGRVIGNIEEFGEETGAFHKSGAKGPGVQKNERARAEMRGSSAPSPRYPMPSMGKEEDSPPSFASGGSPASASTDESMSTLERELREMKKTNPKGPNDLTK